MALWPPLHSCMDGLWTLLFFYLYVFRAEDSFFSKLRAEGDSYTSSSFDAHLSLIWASFDPHLILIWSSSDLYLILMWSSCDPHVILIWSSSDPYLILIWRLFDPHLNLIWSSFDPHLIPFWSSCDPHFINWSTSLLPQPRFNKQFMRKGVIKQMPKTQLYLWIDHTLTCALHIMKNLT